MKTESLEYRDGDVTLRGFLAFDDRKSGKRPGVLIMPEAFGLGAQAKRRAERLADLGYVALAGEKSPYPGNIKWNFSKFLINRDGKIIKRFDSAIKPESAEVVSAVEEALRH